MMTRSAWMSLALGMLCQPQARSAPVEEILNTYCYTCHSPEKQEGELDLQSADIRKDPRLWEHVLEQIEHREMPPKKSKQLSATEETQLVQWIKSTLDEISLSQAGDPGPVVLRRLSNHEYTYTLRDLTGIMSLDPAQEFPVDGAAGEGFTNVGAALVMSPALLTKYLDAAKQVASHAVMTPSGMRWSPSTSPNDWTKETLERIQSIYERHTLAVDGDTKVVDGVKLDTGTGGGQIPLSAYLEALQGRATSEKLNAKYLEALNQGIQNSTGFLLSEFRDKLNNGKLSTDDIQTWQKVLWRFGFVGHLAPDGGPKTWQEPVSNLTDRQEHRLKLDESRDYRVRLDARSVAPGGEKAQVIWEQPRLEVPGRSPLPVSNLPALIAHLEAEKLRLVEHTEQVLADLTHGTQLAPLELRQAWQRYLGMDAAPLQGHVKTKQAKVQGLASIQGWTGEKSLGFFANRSDKSELIPGVVKPHAMSVHAGTEEDAVIAWRSPAKGKVNITGEIVRAHTGCGGGASWSLEVRRGKGVEVLATGVAPAGKPLMLGLFEEVPLEHGQSVMLIVKPRNKNNTCGLTGVELKIQQGEQTWDLGQDVSSDLLRGNPLGAWHFLSQKHQPKPAGDLPAVIVAWRNEPTPANAKKVHEELSARFPLNHPLLANALQQFEKQHPGGDLVTHGQASHEMVIPAALAKGAQLVTTARLAQPDMGGVQTQMLESTTPKAGNLAPDSPILVGESSEAKRHFEKAFAEFRDLFPISMCYARIVPVDEGVTLSLYHREDHHLQRLMLSEQEIQDLDRLWEELRFISEAPLKQFDAFEQLVQYATQIRAERAAELEKLRGSLQGAIDNHQKAIETHRATQSEAVLAFAERAWRRPLLAEELADLRKFEPRMMLARVLTSPNFLYKLETLPEKTSPINDWEFATRLSYFLWSSAPDPSLFRKAQQRELTQPSQRSEVAKQMLKSSKIERLATEFGAQWLHVREVATLDEKSERHFPEFLAVRESMQEEVVRFFTDLFQRDLSVLELLDADHTFVNGILGKHYGLKLEGEHWRKVEGMRALGRGGILGFAAPLAKHAGASRTSAILRGTWLSEVILGDKLPPPPRGVPVLPDEFPEGLTERQLIERHTKDPNCAACHKRIDPYGFALEGFDAIGRSRLADTSTELYDGTSIDGLGQLRDYLLNQRKQDFLQQFCRKFLGFALGRSYQLSDRPLVESMMSSDLKPSTLVALIVTSRQFSEIRGADAQEP